MKSTKIALVAQERPNNERPQERPKKERPKTERPKTERPQETPQRGREEVERKKKERGGEERPQTRGDGDKPVNRERAQGGEAKPKFNKDEAIRMANDCAYGLSASVWTRNKARGESVARQLQSGSHSEVIHGRRGCLSPELQPWLPRRTSPPTRDN